MYNEHGLLCISHVRVINDMKLRNQSGDGRGVVQVADDVNAPPWTLRQFDEKTTIWHAFVRNMYE
jgi:hypothetical protein